MKHVFYLLAIPALLWEISSLLKARKVTRFCNEYRKFAKENDDSAEWPDIYKKFTLLSFGYTIWCIAGLFSSQWILFFLICTLMFIPKRWASVRIIDAFLTLCALLAVILNEYHFHMDLPRLLFSYF